ncbi:MAG: hypothetical protein KatS3mg012_2018 [Gaiellaceae bacterium]|nr:MAG: hypothetical protein KatS3mg012_2018 [Gaiellaceae bacterium]
MLARAEGVESRFHGRVAIVALIALAVVLVRGWARAVPAPVVVLGGMYAAQLVVDDAPLDAGAAVVAAGLLVTAELSYWSLEERERVEAEAGEGWRRLAYVAALGAGAVVTSLALLALAGAVRAAGLAVDLLGIVAAAAAIVGVWALARRESDASL